MIELSVTNLRHGFEVGQNLFEDVTFQVDTGERVGLLGHNGAGKTTLFRMICGEVIPDSGSISLAKGCRVGLISQIPVYPEGSRPSFPALPPSCPRPRRTRPCWRNTTR